MFLPEETNTTTWATACLAEDTDIRLADGTFAPLQHSLGKKIWTDQPNSRKITRIHKFDTLETDPPLCLIEGNWMTESHFIRESMEPKWHRASEFRDNSVTRRTNPKGPVLAVELDTDDYLTLRGGIQAATFGNCLIVEPHRQGYTHDFRFKIDQALRAKGLQRTDLIEWHHGGIGHRADGSLLLDTGFIKLPPRTTGDHGDTTTARTTHLPQQRSYRVCGRCEKPDARLKCACFSTYYCDTKCQREDLPDHRKACTDMILKEITLIRQLQKHKANHGQFTIEVARLELFSTETHVQLGDLLRTSGLGANQQGSEEHYFQALKDIARLEKRTFLVERPSLLYNLHTDEVASHLGLGCLYRDQHLFDKASEQLTQAHDLIQEPILIEDSPGQQDRLGIALPSTGKSLTDELNSIYPANAHPVIVVLSWKNSKKPYEYSAS